LARPHKLKVKLRLKNKILIIGGTGFVGSHLVEEAWTRGLDVHITSRKESSLQNVKGIPLHNHQIDIFNEDALRELISREKFDYIILSMGLAHGTSEELHRVNSAFGGKLCKLIIEERLEIKRLTYMSCLTAIGAADYDVRGRLSTDSTPRPMTEHAKSKLQAEQLFRLYPVIPYTIVRPGMIYGPRDLHRLPLYRLIAKGWLPNLGKEEQNLSLIYVKDVARATLEVTMRGRIFKTYHLAHPEKVTANKFLSTAAYILDVNARQLPISKFQLKLVAKINEIVSKLKNKKPYLTTESAKELIAFSWETDLSEINSMGFVPQYSLQDGLKETLEWYLHSNLL